LSVSSNYDERNNNHFLLIFFSKTVNLIFTLEVVSNPNPKIDTNN